MVPRLRLSAAAAMAAAVGCGPGEQGGEAPAATQAASVALDLHPVVVLETSKGMIAMELDREKAPETVANFLLHVRSSFYDGLTFHRVRPGFMIQAGVLTADGKRRESSVFPIANEAESGLRNVRGAVAMARTTDPHSATSEFFINVVDNPPLDFTARSAQGWGYAVFGRVVEGMDVVDAITAVPTERRGRYEAVPLEPVVIGRAYVREGSS